MIFYQLIEPETSTYTYILADEESKEALLIDTVLETVERDLLLIEQMGLKVKYIIDTHLHADHITGSGEIRKRTGCLSAISAQAHVLCADIALKDNDELYFGKYTLKALSTPGHTNSCMSFYTKGMIFTGDILLFRGTGRTDFQQGDPTKMFNSITQKIFTLPDETIIYPGHDYKGFTYSTVSWEKKFNPRIGANKSLNEFIQIMNALKLAHPKKIDVAVPANIQCGLIN